MLKKLFDLLGGKPEPKITIEIKPTSYEPDPKLLETLSKTIGNTEAVCPYCNVPLPKFPGRKQPCPSCKKVFAVRTRPYDKKRIIVTKEQADKVEEEWSILNGTHDEYLAEKARYADVKKELSEQFGKEAGEGDIKWRMWNEDLMTHAKNSNWGFYRNTRLDMADHLKKEGRLPIAIQTYLEVCYLDSNGPENGGEKRFDPVEGNTFIASGIVKYIKKLAKETSMSEKEIKDLYIKNNTHIHQSLQLPFSPEQAWKAFDFAYTKPEEYEQYFIEETERRKKEIMKKWGVEASKKLKKR